MKEHIYDAEQPKDNYTIFGNVRSYILKTWSNSFLDSEILILQQIFREDAVFSVATNREDFEECTDLNMYVFEKRYRISSRMYRMKNFLRYPNVTFLVKKPSNTKTEFQKIKEGCGDFYFFGWGVENTVQKYILINLKSFRQSGLIEKYEKDLSPHTLVPNRFDNNQFLCIQFYELQENNCIVSMNFVPVDPRLPLLRKILERKN